MLDLFELRFYITSVILQLTLCSLRTIRSCLSNSENRLQVGIHLLNRICKDSGLQIDVYKRQFLETWRQKQLRMQSGDFLWSTISDCINTITLKLFSYLVTVLWSSESKDMRLTDCPLWVDNFIFEFIVISLGNGGVWDVRGSAGLTSSNLCLLETGTNHLWFNPWRWRWWWIHCWMAIQQWLIVSYTALVRKICVVVVMNKFLKNYNRY